MTHGSSTEFLEPSADDFIRAFEALESEGIHEAHADLLRAHYAAPNHTVTWLQLAESVGYSTGGAVNLQYGTFARRVGEKLGIAEPPEGFWLHVLADWAEELGPDGHTAFRLRHSVVEALERIGWSGELTPPSLLETDDFALEGRQSLRLVAHRHREASLRRRRIALARHESSDGKLRCSVPGCGFCFEDVYGDQAAEYIQVHHTKPLGDPNRGAKTHVSELVLVCANCHAMLHYLEPSREVQSLILHRDREV